MSMFNTGDILETIEMFTQDNLDVRTVTMGISLLDCIDPDPKKACENIYNKITTKAANLVPTVEHISAEYGIPIINKRISVTPIAMLLGACPDADPVEFAKTLDAAGKKVGVNFVGGYSALVHKGFSAGDRRLIESIPRALAETDIVCSSVNIGATKAGLNMDAVKLMGEAVKKASELTAGRQCIGAAKLVVFCNAVEDNPFMAGAFHGVGEPEKVLLQRIREEHLPCVLCINKIDTVEKKEALLEVIAAYSAAYDGFDAIIPISARTGDGLDELMRQLSQYAQEGPQLFPDGMTTDQPDAQVCAEIVREKMLLCLEKEIPHGTAGEVTRFTEREDTGIIDLDVTIYCEKASHKGIIIGKHGDMLKRISSLARRDIEKFMGAKVYMETWVKVKENWRDNVNFIRARGYDEQ